MAKLTIDDILARKEQINNPQTKTKTLHISSLAADITIEQPPRALILQSKDMGDDADSFLVYNCVSDPNLKANHQKWMDEFGCAEPHDIVNRLFNMQEVAEIAADALSLAGIKPGESLVTEVKN